MPDIIFDISTEDATTRLGEALALLIRAGDVVALHGDLGAGKTTLARAVLQAFSNDASLEVPSPTYTLTQSYAGAPFRFPILHADLYRLKSSDELAELGFEEALEHGAMLIEWPDLALEMLPSARIDMHLHLDGAQRRAVLSSPDKNVSLRLQRFEKICAFIAATDYAKAQRRFLQGDASPRAYERLHIEGKGDAVLLNALAQPDRSVGEARLKYMAATHLAPNHAIAPILSIGAELRARGLSVPRHLHHNIDACLLLQEDFGDQFIAKDGQPIVERYEAAIDALVHMHAQAWPAIANGPNGVTHDVPVYSREAFDTEAALFIDFFLPVLSGAKPDQKAVADFKNAFDALYASLEKAPRCWTLFDFHSPNVMWLQEREGIARIGLLDYQDTRRGPQAYDLVSLAQDARVTVPKALETALYTRYVAGRRATVPDFDEQGLAAYYAICGAQRATRILGVFARLSHQDGKSGYLKHMPRVSDYLDRCLAHPITKPLQDWFAAHAPQEARMRAANAA